MHYIVFRDKFTISIMPIVLLVFVPDILRRQRGRSCALGQIGICLAYAKQLTGPNMTERNASLFRNGRNQAVRIPREFEMEGTEVVIRKDGDRLILTPIRKNRLLDLLASWEPLDEGLPDVEDGPPQTRDAF